MRLSLLSALSFLVLGPTFASVATIHVPGQYPTIQDGIDAADEGDTVLVAAGVYTGLGNINLDFGGTNLVLLSESGPEDTIIDIGGFPVGISFSGGETPTSRVEGFTVTNGGTGIAISVSSPTIEDCVITGNAQTSLGAGIFLNRSNAHVVNCSIWGNEAWWGGGIYLYAGGPLIDGCTVFGNVADQDGGGICIGPGGNPTLTDCIIAANSAGSNGGGIYAEEAHHAYVEGCLIVGNSAGSDGGGIYLIDTDPIWFTSCTVSGNLAEQGGGLHGVLYSYPRADRTIIWGNCSELPGDEIFFSPSSELWIECSDVDSSGVEGDLVLFGEVLHDDPLFCDPEPCESAPTTEGDYSLASGSPCLPENNPCGELIGALGEGCSQPSFAPPAGSVRPRDLVILAAPVPNPSSLPVACRMSIPRAAKVTLRVYDIRGRLVSTLVDGDLPSGTHDFSWDPVRRGPGRVGSGVYQLTLEALGVRKTRKFVVAW